MDNQRHSEDCMTASKAAPRFGNVGSRRALRGPRGRFLESHFWQGRKFWILAAWLALVFLLGGGSRSDIQSLILLRPVSVIVFGYGLVELTSDVVRQNRFVLSLAALWIALPLLQLVPLPPSIWHSLPGREIIVEIDRTARFGDIWRPMTMAPAATRNAFWSSFAPLATLVLAVQLTLHQQVRLVGIILVLGLASAFLGLVQLLSEPQGPFYLYAVTNNGAAVGLFANRNHQALLLASMIPMLFVWTRAHRGVRRQRVLVGLSAREIGALLAGLFLIPLILVTGSRSGMLCASIGLLTLPLFSETGQAGNFESGKIGPLRTALFLTGLVGLVGLTIWLDRAEAFTRLVTSDPATDLRVRVLPTLWTMIGTHFPWGSGMGSFEKVYQIYEPDGLLSSKYMNHAHNDWLELALTGGVPGMLILAVAILGFGKRLVAVARARDGSPVNRLGRLGLAVLGLILLASLSDYPLRVPSLACMAALLAVWAGAAVAKPPDSPQKS
jgi:lipoprotein signal peptidase